jgi:flagellar biosynthesis repressor protein FlbT
MSLKITLKKNERLIVDGAVIRNGGKATVLFVENVIPILREKDIMGEKDADTPCKRVYFIVQLIVYIDEASIPQYRRAYAQLAREIVETAPSMSEFIDLIDERLQARKYYQALKGAQSLIEYEAKQSGTSHQGPGEE